MAVPTGASVWSTGASVGPAAISTAPLSGIAVPPPTAAAVTVDARSVFGAVAGNGCNTISAAPGTAGGRGPHAGGDSVTAPPLRPPLLPPTPRRRAGARPRPQNINPAPRGPPPPSPPPAAPPP